MITLFLQHHWAYARRPLVLQGTPDQGILLFGKRHLVRTMMYIADCVMGGRLQPASAEMRTLVGELNDERGRTFNDSVAQVFAHLPWAVVRKNVKKVRGMRLAGSQGDLGDVADRRSGRIIAIESKDVARARTPAEMRSEIAALFITTGGARATLDKHHDRVEWLRTHLGALLEWLNLESKINWVVSGVIVLDEELFTPYLSGATMSVLSRDRLAERVQNEDRWWTKEPGKAGGKRG